MAVLVMRFSGPLQSWGGVARFNRRTTEREPTKSAVVGLLAAALGRSREDSIDDLAELEMAVRIDQPGEMVRDFQTEHLPSNGKSLPLTQRYYLADAKFTVALSGPLLLLEELKGALVTPRWPLYLGRRSCPPDRPILDCLLREDQDVREVLGKVAWIADERYQVRQQREGSASLTIVCDARAGEICESRQDCPVSFSIMGRSYRCRPVYHGKIELSSLVKGEGEVSGAGDGESCHDDHDPMIWL